MIIDGRKVNPGECYLEPVTYVPTHCKGNAGHKNCEQGVIIEIRESTVRVLYCKSRTVQQTRPEDLVWG